MPTILPFPSLIARAALPAQMLAVLCGLAATTIVDAAPARAPITAPPEPAGMVPLFNGRDLTGWEGDMRLWTVRNGMLRGETTPTVKTKGNTFLVWKGGEPANFELRLSYRMNTTNNSGVQYRSRLLPHAPTAENKWVVAGYQAEVRNEPGVSGFIFDEKGKRGRMCRVGQKVVWTAEGKQVVGSVGDTEAIAATFRTDDWNDYIIIAQGSHIRHYLNGVQTIDFTDDDPVNRLTSGIIALQLHGGAPMWVEFRNLRLKTLP